MHIGNRYRNDDTLPIRLPETQFTASGILLEIFKQVSAFRTLFFTSLYMNYKNRRENINSIEENYFYGGNHCDRVGLDSQFS